MTLLHIEPMSPTAEVTEPGWYVATSAHGLGGCGMVAVVERYGRLRALLAGDATDSDLGHYDFIARIYPDRIAARAQALSDLAAMDGETL